MKNIVITNCYGYENIGDGAILDSSLKLLNKIFKNKTISIHTATDSSIKILKRNNIKTYLHPYGVAIKTSTGPISNFKKIPRFLMVISTSLYYGFFGKIFPNILPESGNFAYIKSLKDADIVFGIGGGYLRTKSKYKDFFGLLLTLLPIYIAHLYRKRILYLPMSYGNFASTLHDKMAFKLIKNDLIIFRDEISLKEFSKHTDKILDTHLIPDLVLFDKYKNNIKNKKDYIVLTARLWMNESKQKKYEQELALFIDYVWEKYRLKTIFIPMVWNKNEDDDTAVGEKIKKLVKNKSIFTISKVKNSLEVKNILSNARAAICTRMHSAILATIVKSPFITIAYEYKTLGFLKHLELEKWNIDIEKLSAKKLQEKFDDLINNQYQQFISKLKTGHQKIIRKENELIGIIKMFQSIN